MGLTIRHYIFQDDGALKRVPRRIVDALPFGTDAIPEYAGTTQRNAQVLIDNEDGKPVRILDVIGSYWVFDEHGKIDESLRRSGAEWLSFAFSTAAHNKTDGPVVDLVPELKRKDLHKRHRWTVTKDELDLIASDIWPGINGPAPDVEAVKGKAPKKPPLTQDAKWALDEIEKNVIAIKHRIDMLSERALKGLPFEAIRSSMWDDESLWRAVSDEAKRREAVRAAHRTGRGEWYAVIERALEDNDRPYVWNQVSVAHAKGANRKEALEAGRRLMAERADWLEERHRDLHHAAVSTGVAAGGRRGLILPIAAPRSGSGPIDFRDRRGVPFHFLVEHRAATESGGDRTQAAIRSLSEMVQSSDRVGGADRSARGSDGENHEGSPS